MTLPILRPGRKIQGMSAILLPFGSSHEIDWEGFESHLERTLTAGLIPAVNMDTGYGNLIESATRVEVLERTKVVAAGSRFLAGAFVGDHPGALFKLDDYQRELELVESYDGTPIIFQSYGLAGQSDDQIVESYQQISRACHQFYAFELGEMFAPFGRIYHLDVFRELLTIPNCIGAKHSSLDRKLEWQRLEVRDQLRPEFQLLTGNDLAIDMVMYGSDYLLGLSTFCPDLFARRDYLWEQEDPEFFQLNDVLQYLGCFAFRNPTSAYKHNAAMFLHGRGWIQSGKTHAKSPQRPDSDYAVLYEIGRQLGLEMKSP